MSILLTGATGFVGGAIAADLSAKGLLADTRFAVRGDTPADGLARLRSNLRRFQLPQAVLDGITESQIVPFDLRNAGEAKLGDPEVIINCAALATFWLRRARASSASCRSARPCRAANWPTTMSTKAGKCRRSSSTPCPTRIPRGWPS